MRVSYEQMRQEFRRVLLKNGLTTKRAERCAAIFAENSLVGVASHGLNRFPGFIEFIHKGYVKPDVAAEQVAGAGAWEQWDGKQGVGPLNAYTCTERAMALAKAHGVGCVGLRNTNHWMRGGYYGWLAAEADFALISWTNTKPNMPAWGGFDRHVGNNPLVLAVPRKEGPVVLDMAMSQFSIGRMEGAQRGGQSLPIPGGYDEQGELTRDPGAILATNRVLPAGYWKGSGLAVLLDLVAVLLSGGLATYQIGQQETEYNVAQVFIAFDVTQSASAEAVNQAVEDVIADLRTTIPANKGGEVLYPGERALRTRLDNLQKGIPVEPAIWERVLAM